MEAYLKERLVGAGVLIVLAVIFIPMFLSDEPVMLKQEKPAEEIKTPEPAEPVVTEKPKSDYQSSIVPVDDGTKIEEVKDEVETPEVLAKEATPEKQVEKPKENVTASSKSATESATLSARNDVGSTQAWVVQLGSFSSEANAQVLNKRLLKHKFPSFVEPLVKEDKVVYRVRVGPALQKSKIERLKSDIKKKLKLDGILVKYP